MLKSILRESNINSKVLLRKYNNVKFSEDFYKHDDNMREYLINNYLNKIDKFIVFYKKYQPKGVRIIDGKDVYEESKKVYDKIINGAVFIDEVFTDPDSPLRNVVMLLHIDEPSLVRRSGIR